MILGDTPPVKGKEYVRSLIIAEGGDLVPENFNSIIFIVKYVDSNQKQTI